MTVVAGLCGAERDSVQGGGPRGAAVRVCEGPGGGRSRIVPDGQVSIGMAIRLVNVTTASLTQGHVAGSRR